MHYLQTKYAHRIRNKYLKSINNEMNATRRQGGSDVRSGVTDSMGLYNKYLCDGAYLRAVFSFNALLRQTTDI